MSILRLPNEVLHIIATFIVEAPFSYYRDSLPDLRIPGRLVTEYYFTEKLNGITQEHTLLAFANSCSTLKKVLSPLIYKACEDGIGREARREYYKGIRGESGMMYFYDTAAPTSFT